jgi:hypothetical protein
MGLARHYELGGLHSKMKDETDPVGLSILGAPLVVGTIVFLFGAAIGFVLSESEILDSPWNVGLYANADELDENGDGEPDAWYVYRSGNLARSKHDRNRDGQPDLWLVYRKNLIVRADADNNFDGAIDEWTSYRFGDPYETEQDTDHNGVPDVTWRFADGILHRGEWHPNRGPVQREWHFVSGVLREVLTRDSDGSTHPSKSFDAFGAPESSPQ